jgi:hypothetical protein
MAVICSGGKSAWFVRFAESVFRQKRTSNARVLIAFSDAARILSLHQHLFQLFFWRRTTESFKADQPKRFAPIGRWDEFGGEFVEWSLT